MDMSGFDDLEKALDDFEKKAIEDAHEFFAQEVARRAREDGLTSADEVEIDVETDTDDVGIDVERIRRRANEILAEGQ